MSLLLDLQALIWALVAPEKLALRARTAISAPENALFFSVASDWEIELEASKGKLILSKDWLSAAAGAGFNELEIESADAAAGARLPWHRQDPFDRMLIAQSLAHGFSLVTRDAVFGAFGASSMSA